MTLKDKFGLTTDKASDIKSGLYTCAAVIASMPDSMTRSGLIALWLLIMAIVSYLQVGNIAPEQADLIKRVLDGRDTDQ